MAVFRLIVLLSGLLVLGGCSTLKSWFTPQGQRLSLAKGLADRGHPLGASALSVEALVIDPQYQDAQNLLIRTFPAGQEEFRLETAKWLRSDDPARWDHLYEIYSWQNTLNTRIPELPPLLDSKTGLAIDFTVLDVTEERRQAALNAAVWHLEKGRTLLGQLPGPRQARRALAEGRVARGFDPEAPGLEDWLSRTEELATQKLLVIPFFLEASWALGAASGPLGSELSRRLLEGPGLPELTEVFPSDRLITLPGGALARLGFVSQPAAMKLAAEAGQNMVLMGQFTKAGYQPPKSTVKVEARERRVVVVGPEHPEGVVTVWKATVTSTTWSTSAFLSASFSLVEVPTTKDLVTAVRDAHAGAQIVVTTFTGNKEALTPDDLRALSDHSTLPDPDTLGESVIASLAEQIAAVVREAID